MPFPIVTQKIRKIKLAYKINYNKNHILLDEVSHMVQCHLTTRMQDQHDNNLLVNIVHTQGGTRERTYNDFT